MDFVKIQFEQGYGRIQIEKPEDWGIAVIGAGATIKTGTHIAPGTMVSAGEEV